MWRLSGARSTWFPTTYHEPLIAFPAELRRSDTSLTDDKTLHEEEERRLFYVAMTRAKDTLALYTHQGRSRKDPKPTQFLREFMLDPSCRKFWFIRSAAAVQETLFAEEEQKIALEQSNVAAWLLMPPSADFVTGLSASAIVIYEECPLRFKLEREWNLPRDVSASLHYGSAMHGVLRTFYDAQRYERAISDEELLEQFRFALASAGIADRYQYELYLRQGKEQLQQFLEAARNSPRPEVMETERKFELLVGSSKLAGRVDRIDRTGPDSVAIVDYKTGKPQSQEDADKSLQLSLYALAARDAWGKRADRSDLLQPRRTILPFLLPGTTASWKQPRYGCKRWLIRSLKGISPRNLATTAPFALIGIFVRRRKKWWRVRRRSWRRGSIRCCACSMLCGTGDPQPLRSG